MIVHPSTLLPRIYRHSAWFRGPTALPKDMAEPMVVHR